MLQQERFAKIAEYLRAHQTATLSDISVLNSVSMDTTRRDFEKLEKLGVLKRVRGGAVYIPSDDPSSDLSAHYVTTRTITPYSEELSSHILEGQTVSINSGMESLAIARFLIAHYERLIILTNSLPVLELLASARKFKTIVPRGVIDPIEKAIIGKQCEQDILQYNVDTAILSANAISLEHGVTDFNADRVGIIYAMMLASLQKIFAASHQKFQTTSPMHVCDIHDIKTVISDTGLSSELHHAYTSHGITILTPFSP